MDRVRPCEGLFSILEKELLVVRQFLRDACMTSVLYVCYPSPGSHVPDGLARCRYMFTSHDIHRIKQKNR